VSAVLRDVPIGARLADTTNALDAQQCAAFRSQGVDGLFVYLGSPNIGQRVQWALGAGLGVKPVCYSQKSGWTPSADLGAQRGAKAVSDAHAAAFPQGIDIYCDLEGSGGDVAATTAYLNAWARQVVDAGFIAGLYVGADQPLNGSQLYALAEFHRYWRSFSSGVPDPACGFCLVQLYPTTAISGIPVDFDFAQNDYQGRSALWLIDAPAMAGAIPVPFTPSFSQSPPEAA
jgi:hypothetical protein